MSRKCSTWADKHVVGRDGAQRLLEAIADWCNDDGVTFVGQKKLQYKVAPMPLSSVKANFKYLKDRGYIRTEQRHNPVTKARMTDIIYLNLEKWDTQKISFEEAEEVMKQTGMSLDELMKSPLFLKGAHQHYIDMHSGPGLKNLPGSESVDNMPKSPGLKNLPGSTKVGFTGDQGRFHSSEGGSRVNRNARAQINLKIKDSSISQSVKSSGSVENSDGSTDGWTKNENSKPLESATNPENVSQLTPDGTVEAPSANPARMEGPVAARQEYLPSVCHRGVDISRVRSNLVHAGIPAKQTSDNQLIVMIDIVLKRALGPVHSPNGFVTTALKNDWYRLVSKAEEKSLNSAGSGAVCRQHRCHLSVTGECKRCIAEQRAADLDDLHHELVWKKNLTQIDVATLEVSLRHGGYAIDSISVKDFGQHITVALNSGVAPTTDELFRYFADNQEIFTHNAASDKEFAGFGHERTA